MVFLENSMATSSCIWIGGNLVNLDSIAFIRSPYAVCTGRHEFVETPFPHYVGFYASRVWFQLTGVEHGIYCDSDSYRGPRLTDQARSTFRKADREVVVNLLTEWALEEVDAKRQSSMLFRRVAMERWGLASSQVPFEVPSVEQVLGASLREVLK